MGNEHQSQDTGEVQEVLSCQEDRLESGEFGHDEVEDEAQDEDHGHFRAVGIQRQSRGDFHLRGDAFNAEGKVENRGEVVDHCRHGIGTDGEDHETDDGLQGARYHFRGVLFLRRQSNQGDDAHDECGIPALRHDRVHY